MESTSQEKAQLIERAINVLQNAGDTAAEQIDSRISELENEIKKLKQIRKVISKVSGDKPEKKTNSCETLEPRIIELIKSGKPMKPGAIASQLGVAAVAVGVCISRSQRLAKNVDGFVIIRK